MTLDSAHFHFLHRADAVFVATHSQGCVASTQLLDRLITEGHIYTGRNSVQVAEAAEIYGFKPRTDPQRVCLLGLCGVHHGPLSWMNNSTVVSPYLTYFEAPAARELFEFQARGHRKFLRSCRIHSKPLVFQDSESRVSKAYHDALSRVLDNGAKFVYVASLNDQVVPV